MPIHQQAISYETANQEIRSEFSDLSHLTERKVRRLFSALCGKKENAMAKMSAGLMMYRFRDGLPEVFLVHPGGPFWRRKDEGAWSIPKGEYVDGEDPFEVAKREFEEETGFSAEGDFLPLSPLRQPSRKQISAWAFEGDCDATKIKSNEFEMEWPPGSGRMSQFPEVDRAEWFSIPEARKKLLKGQLGFLDQLCTLMK